MNTLAVTVLVVAAAGFVALLAVHGYVMSDGRLWVGIAQPVIVIGLVWLLVWSMMQVSP